MGLVADNAAVIIHAIGGDWPTIVLTWLWNVNLITTFGPMLGCPKFAGIWVDGCTLYVTVAIRPNLRQRICCVHKGVVSRDSAIGFDTYHLTVMIVQSLGIIHG